jgi:transcriptional regulator with XRE-family HTH domain
VKKGEDITNRFVETLKTLEDRAIPAWKTRKDLAQALDCSQGIISEILGGRMNVTTHLLQKFFKAYDVNPDYIFFGEGEMFNTEGAEDVNFTGHGKPYLKTIPNPYPTSKTQTKGILNEAPTKYQAKPVLVTVDEGGKDNIVLVDIKAAAGYVQNISEPKYIRQLPAFKLPGAEFRNATFRAFQVEGDSMFDTIYPGDYVVARHVEDHSQMRDGYVYVIVTKEGVAVKRALNRVKERGKLVLQSDNEDFAPFEVDISDVQEIWLVKLLMAFNMPNRKRDLNRKVTKLESEFFDVVARLQKLEKRK